MAETFDAYHKWLGIPPEHQPPNLYRLLGINLFESDPDVVEAAADKQFAYLKGCASGPHVALSQKLLNEISAARLCLLNPAKKAAYDASLKADFVLAGATIPAAQPQVPPTVGAGLESDEINTALPTTAELEWISKPSTRPASKSSRQRKGPSPVGIILSGMGGLFLVMAVYSWTRGKPDDARRNAPQKQASVEQEKASTPVNESTRPTSQVSVTSAEDKSRANPIKRVPEVGATVKPKPAQSTETKPLLQVINRTDAKEANEVVSAILAAYPATLASAARIELLKYHDATEFHRNAGNPTTLPGSYSGAPVAGRHGAIMLWGVYENLPPGRYLVVYRIQSLSEIAGDNICFLDVCAGGNTIAEHRPIDTELERGQWKNVPVVMNLEGSEVIEYRLWPNNHTIAIDRVYVFQFVAPDSLPKPRNEEPLRPAPAANPPDQPRDKSAGTDAAQSLAERVETLAKMNHAARTPLEFKKIAEKGMDLVTEALAGGDPAMAKHAAAIVLTAARKSGDADLEKKATLRYMESQKH